MANYSPNYNLYLPSRNDADVEVDTSLTTNFTNIDNGLANHAAQLADVMSQRIYVTDKKYGADNTGSSDSTTAFSSAIADVPTNGILVIPPGTYLGHLSIRRSNITVIAYGVTIKIPNGVDSIVLEVGNTAQGNSALAYTNVNILGFPVLDGNYTNTPVPSGDLTGQGFIATNTTKSHWEIKSQNTHNAGVAVVINSNENTGKFIVDTCGMSQILGGYYPSFDINSSKYNQFDFISLNSTNGGRLLDNCFNNLINGVIKNATSIGFIYNNQSLNESRMNQINVTIDGGCSSDGVQVGVNCKSSQINATVYNVTGNGVRELGDSDGLTAGTEPRANTYNVTSELGQSSACVINGLYSKWNINSYKDGRQGLQGSHYAINVGGAFNTINATITDDTSWQVRGISMGASSHDNVVGTYTSTNIASALDNAGTNNLKVSTVAV